MVKKNESKYLIDTNVLIAMLRGNQQVRNKIKLVSNGNCYVSEISIAELFYGAAKSGRMKNLQDVERILQMFEVVPMYSSLKLYGELKADLERQGMRIDDFDLLIGASAIANGMVMVSANTKHFARINGIELEDWEHEV